MTTSSAGECTELQPRVRCQLVGSDIGLFSSRHVIYMHTFVAMNNEMLVKDERRMMLKWLPCWYFPGRTEENRETLNDSC